MSAQHTDRIADQFFGPPDLVMEVASPSTKRTDRTDKAEEYARAGIPEYWLADPDARTVEVFVLKGQRYELLGRWDVDGVARSSLLPGFEVAVGRLFL